MNSDRHPQEEQPPGIGDKIIAQVTIPRALLVLVLLAVLLFFYWFRAAGIIHGPVLLLYTWPLLWMLPLLALILVGISYLIRRRIAAIRKQKDGQQKSSNYSHSYYYSYYQRPRISGWVWGALGAVFSALMLAIIIQSPLNSQATYSHYKFTITKQIPEISTMRLLPKQVAEQMVSSGFDSSTERLDAGHIYVDQQGELQWSFAQVPNGFFRYWSKKSAGLTEQSAQQTWRKMSSRAQQFKYSPHTGLTDGLYWQLYKRDYFSKIAATVFMIDDRGQPVIVAPFIKYRGFISKVPYLAGVYVVDASGEIAEYSPQQAAQIPYLANSGQLFPASLARQVQESYKYRGGIWNRFFIHEDQIEIADTEENAQPYLATVAGRQPQWISSAQPYGRSYATKALFLTDSVTGDTEIWEPEENQSLSGNARALEVVRGLAIPGVVFNKFRAIEPRPIFIDGRFKFIISVAPKSLNNVSKTVIVDAASNKAEQIFHHDRDPQADQKLKRYLRTGQEVAIESAAKPQAQDKEAGKYLWTAEQRQALQRLREQNRQQAELLQQLLQQSGG